MLDTRPQVSQWTISDAIETYEISRWGNDYFSINEWETSRFIPPARRNTPST